MSRIEASAKIPLSRLMMGTLPHLIFEKHQRALVEWIALKMFVIDCDRPFGPAFKQESRKAFYARREIPDNLKIDLFRHDDDIWTAQFRRFATMVEIGAEAADLPIIYRNTQSLAFGVGYLLIFAFHSDIIKLPLDPKPAVSRRLWPAPEGIISWPPVVTLSGDDADAVSEIVKDHITRRFGIPAQRPNSRETRTPS